MDNTLRILVVDDNHDSADSLARLLALWGYPTRAAYDAKAIDVAREFHPDVFLIDLAMPGVDGCTLAKVIRHQPEHREALLIAVSGYHDADHKSRAKEAGFAHYFVKPVELLQLKSILEAARLAATTAVGPVGSNMSSNQVVANRSGAR